MENSTSAGTPDAIQKASFQPIDLCKLPPPLEFPVVMS
jgi:hypothetical protein